MNVSTNLIIYSDDGSVYSHVLTGDDQFDRIFPLFAETIQQAETSYELFKTSPIANPTAYKNNKTLAVRVGKPTVLFAQHDPFLRTLFNLYKAATSHRLPGSPPPDPARVGDDYCKVLVTEKVRASIPSILQRQFGILTEHASGNDDFHPGGIISLRSWDMLRNDLIMFAAMNNGQQILIHDPLITLQKDNLISSETGGKTCLRVTGRELAIAILFEFTVARCINHCNSRFIVLSGFTTKNFKPDRFRAYVQDLNQFHTKAITILSEWLLTLNNASISGVPIPEDTRKEMRLISAIGSPARHSPPICMNPSEQMGQRIDHLTTQANTLNRFREEEEQTRRYFISGQLGELIEMSLKFLSETEEMMRGERHHEEQTERALLKLAEATPLPFRSKSPQQDEEQTEGSLLNLAEKTPIPFESKVSESSKQNEEQEERALLNLNEQTPTPFKSTVSESPQRYDGLSPCPNLSIDAFQPSLSDKDLRPTTGRTDDLFQILSARRAGSIGTDSGMTGEEVTPSHPPSTSRLVQRSTYSKSPENF